MSAAQCFFFCKFSLVKKHTHKNKFVLNNGRSPGFGLTLVAETLNGYFLSAEMSSTPQGQGDPIPPEDLGRNCAKLLLEEIYRVCIALTLSLYVHTFMLVLTDMRCHGHRQGNMFPSRNSDNFCHYASTAMNLK